MLPYAHQHPELHGPGQERPNEFHESSTTSEDLFQLRGFNSHTLGFTEMGLVLFKRIVV